MSLAAPSLLVNDDQLRLTGDAPQGAPIVVVLPGPMLQPLRISVLFNGSSQGLFDPNAGPPTTFDLLNFQPAAAALIFADPVTGNTSGPQVRFDFSAVQVVTNAAGIIEYQFSGVVTEVDPLLSTVFSLGQSGVFRTTIEADATDLNSQPDAAFYQTQSTFLQVGDYVATDAIGAGLRVKSDEVRFVADSPDGTAVAGAPREVSLSPSLMTALLTGDPGTFDPSGGIPMAFDLNALDLAAGALIFPNSESGNTSRPLVRFDFSAVDVKIVDDAGPIPEPSGIAMLLTGFVLIGLFRSSVGRTGSLLTNA